MIRFSHVKNSWQVSIGQEWICVSAAATRLFWDKGYRLVASQVEMFQ